MSRSFSFDGIKKIWPENGPDINQVQKYIKKYKDEKIVIKCAGNVLIDPKLFNSFIEDIVINITVLNFLYQHQSNIPLILIFQFHFLNQ